MTFHTLRHTFASWLVQSGRQFLEVAKLLGHSDVKVTMRYAHLAPNNLRAAVDALAAGEFVSQFFQAYAAEKAAT